MTFRTLAPAVLAAIFLAASPAHPLELARYLPAGTSHDPAVPTPASVLGWELGTWHVRHDHLVHYMAALAERSPRVELSIQGHTHEQRPLLLLTISSPANLERLEEIRGAHRRFSEPGTETDPAGQPVVVLLGYSIHGNEPSGANAALAVAYHFAAAQGPEIEALLANTIILLDPSFNPDGLDRFASWANMHRGRVAVADPDHREHREGWPSGRTNHYWFDLNRDWLLAQHPESQARLRTFHAWRPNVVVDFHEMGTDGTFFFQPGIPSQQNPLTPAQNLELTRAFARENARALDAKGRLYYTEETFDDFYFGKGSTYPDIQGAIGILFEQASSRGHLQESEHGLLSFPFTIENQVTASLTTVQTAAAKREELLRYQGESYREARREAESDPLRGYLFGDPADPVRTTKLAELLRRHDVEVRALAAAVETGGMRFEPGNAFVVPLAQRQARLVRAMFDVRTTFVDTSFYDVSTWTLPWAYGVPWAAADHKLLPEKVLGAPLEAAPRVTGQGPSAGAGFAHVFAWDGYYAPRTLYDLLAAGVEAMVATRSLTLETGGGRLDFAPGAIVVPAQRQMEGTRGPDPEELATFLRTLAERDGLTIATASSGLTPAGIDLGSPSLRTLRKPRPALLVGGEVQTYDAGEVWYLLDHGFEIPLSLLEIEDFKSYDLGRYTHLIVVDGDYQGFGEAEIKEIERWVRGGGILITTQRAARWVEQKLLGSVVPVVEPSAPADEPPPGEHHPPIEPRPYAEHETDRARQLISGAIFEVDLDLTHPLAYGYRRPRLPVFRDGTVFLRAESDPYAAVARYTPEPLLSGHVSSENLASLRGTPALVANRLGEGLVVRFADDPVFRGFWYATHKLLLNALFFGQVVEETKK